MIFGSVCSGIEAATVAWQPLGWSPTFYAEIDPFPCALLRHYHPDVPNLGNITRFQAWPHATLDVLVGGTPCQSFSVAGLRAGLADPRGNLALVYLAILDRYRPRWCVWENVPGVLSSDGGRDFGAFLGGLGQLGYGFAYRVLDAQHFGLAQRRRRVFVVGHLGNWQRAAAVLFERASLSGHPAPRREAGQSAPTIPSRRSAGGGLGTDFDCDGGLIHVDVAPTLRAGGNATGGDRPYGTDVDTCDSLIAHAFDARQSDVIQYGDQAGPLDTDGHTIGVAYPIISDADRIDSSARTPSPDAEGRIRLRDPGLGIGNAGDPMFTIQATKPHAVATSMQVRRLTPRECERLQGFPDDYTAIPYRGKPAADGPRYKALGNSMAVPCMYWIGKRIQMVEDV